MNTLLSALRETPEIRSIDVHMALFASSLDIKASAELIVATALASQSVARGDVCTHLADCLQWAIDNPSFDCADNLQQWREVLQTSQAVTLAGTDSTGLLILDEGDRLYLRRYYVHEQAVANWLAAATSISKTKNNHQLSETLDLLFPPQQETPDWQRVAVATALRQRFCVISGGPGTGKTRTVARLLCALQHLSSQPIRMKLVAPTGKAAARLAQSIQRELPELSKLLPQAAALIPSEASTLHRLLGYRASGSFAHDHTNPLALELLLVDEASMLDLTMMARLLEAVPSHARLILLGDRDQLASVEAGNVLGDICADYFDYVSLSMYEYLAQVAKPAEQHLHQCEQPLADSICLLRKSYRFDEDSGVGAFARAVNSGDWRQCDQLLRNNHQELQHRSGGASMTNFITERFMTHFKSVIACGTVQQALQQLSKFQLLVALRKGPAGIEDINEHMALALRRSGIISYNDNHKAKPIMIVQNDYTQGLYNGDVGLFWPDNKGELQAYFEDGNGGVRSFLAARLPTYESCYAMTIHKTQGSEFEEVCLLLPQQTTAILTRQLLYTAVTRARRRVAICGELAVIEHMVSSSVERRSGLRESLT